MQNQTNMEEQVNHPAHYLKDGKECIDCMEQELGIVTAIGFCLGNAYKYEWRAGLKQGNSAEQDLSKAEWYKKKAKELLVKVHMPEYNQTINLL